MKKLTFTVMAIFFSSSLLISQDLVEAARKEKERRAQIKKKSAIIVTNADLLATERQAILKITAPEDQSQNALRTTPQKTQRTPPATPPRPRKSPPSQQPENVDQMDLRVDQVDQSQERGFSREYATQVLETTEFARNPQLALDEPDGQYAELDEFGSIDLEIDVQNRSGDDIAIYARRQKRGVQLVTMNYGVFVEHKGDWEFIGFGGGETSPETFDLGNIQSAKKIRLMFKDFSQSMWIAKPYRHDEVVYSMGIDAVKSLHR